MFLTQNVETGQVQLRAYFFWNVSKNSRNFVKFREVSRNLRKFKRVREIEFLEVSRFKLALVQVDQVESIIDLFGR